MRAHHERFGWTGDVGLLVLRASTGLMMLLSHGVPKLGKLGQSPVEFADPVGLGPTMSLWMAVGAEVVCAGLVVLGLWTRLACVPLLVTMLVAAFVVHGADPFAKKEFALLYAVPFLTLVLTGPGRFSLDDWWRHRKAR